VGLLLKGGEKRWERDRRGGEGTGEERGGKRREGVRPLPWEEK